MDEDATWYGSRHRRRPHCIRRVSSAPRKGHSTPSFRPMSIVATVAQLSYYWALVRCSYGIILIQLHANVTFWCDIIHDESPWQKTSKSLCIVRRPLTYKLQRSQVAYSLTSFWCLVVTVTVDVSVELFWCFKHHGFPDSGIRHRKVCDRPLKSSLRVADLSARNCLWNIKRNACSLTPE